MRGQSARLPAGQSGLRVRRAGARSRALVHGSRASDERSARHFVSAARACSRGARLTVAVLAWSRTAAWKGMLNAVLMDDQRAKTKAGFSCQFGYQLADGTAQKLRNLAPVHSVRDRGVGGSNPLAPTTLLEKRAEFSLLDHSVPSEWSVPQIALGSGIQAQKRCDGPRIVRLLLG
jgi:hypothetical protein